MRLFNIVLFFIGFASPLILLHSQSTLAYDVCGDRVCGITESSYSCTADCPAGGADQYCDAKQDRVCDPDCFDEDPDCANQLEKSGAAPKKTPVIVKKGYLLRGILFLLLLGMLIVLVIILLRRIKGEGPSHMSPSQSGVQQADYPQTREYPYPQQPPLRPNQ